MSQYSQKKELKLSGNKAGAAVTIELTQVQKLDMLMRTDNMSWLLRGMEASML